MQKSYLLRLCGSNPDAVIVGSLGNISKDLEDIPHDNKILIRGAMGSAIGCGLGYALSSTKQVIVVIGEGALIMHLGSLANVVRHNLPNLRIVVLNNGCYKSCGGQSNQFKFIKQYLPPTVEVVDVE